MSDLTSATLPTTPNQPDTAAADHGPRTATPATDPPGRRRAHHRHRISIATLAAGLWLVLVVGGAILAPLIAPYGPTEQTLLDSLQGPSAAHLLGTDDLGRDLLSRLMYGARPSLIGVALAMAMYLVVGTSCGLIAGYLAGWTDRVISAVTTIVIAMPGIIVLFVVLSVFRGNTYVAMIVFGLISSPVMVLLIRSSALSLRSELFVDAAKVSGLGAASIIFGHILPRIRSRVIVQTAVYGANAVVVESALSFLGFGKQPPAPTWGNLVAGAASVLSLSPWMLYPTGGAIALTALAFGVIGDRLGAASGRSWSTSNLTPDRRIGEHRRAPAAQQESAAEGDAAPLLSVSGLHVGYRDGSRVLPIVQDVSFAIGRGKTVGLVGESGSGKTTVAFGVLGVVGAGVEVSAGSVTFDGVDLLGLTGKELAPYRGKRIGYVAQEPMVALDPSYRVGDQLAEAVRRNDKLSGTAVRERVQELLRTVELPKPDEVARKYPHELSGGMAQRVSIAFALSGRPELLIADEPTTALDVTVQAGILGLLMRLRDETGMAMLIITHDWGVIADVCDDVVVMYRGEIVETDSASRIFDDPQHPYTRALLASNPHGASPDEDLPVTTGRFPTPLHPLPAEGECS